MLYTYFTVLPVISLDSLQNSLFLLYSYQLKIIKSNQDKSPIISTKSNNNRRFIIFSNHLPVDESNQLTKQADSPADKSD